MKAKESENAGNEAMSKENKRGREKRTRPPGKGRQWSVPGTPPQKPLSTQMPFAFLPQQEEKLALWD